MTTIRGNVDLIRRMGEADDATMDVVQDELQRMTRLVDDLLLLARADTGGLPIQQKPVELDSIFLDVYRQVGSLDQPVPRNEFLCTEKEYRDFELRLKVRLLGETGRANAGIQIRSRRIPNHHDMIGYQADLGQDYWGALYDESRRRTVLARQSAILAEMLWTQVPPESV